MIKQTETNKHYLLKYSQIRGTSTTFRVHTQLKDGKGQR